MDDKRWRLAINRCPEHGFHSVSIDEGSGGSRVTPSKCCGRWVVVSAWALSAREWDEIRNLAEQAALAGD